jgi:hypothetical protein
MTCNAWRSIERELISFFASHRIHMDDVTGEQTIEVVRYREAGEVDGADEIATALLSLEHLAKHLAEEFKIPV